MPAQAGIQSSKAPLCGMLFYWIPASAGMTAKGAFAGMAVNGLSPV